MVAPNTASRKSPTMTNVTPNKIEGHETCFLGFLGAGGFPCGGPEGGGGV
jgi:hypothetical protein